MSSIPYINIYLKEFLWVIFVTAAAAAKSLQSCLTVRPQRRQLTRLPRPWDSPGKNTGVGCHFLLQCRKVKSESEVTQLCRTIHNPMDCSPPGSSVHGIFQARVLEWGAIAFSNICYSALIIGKPMPFPQKIDDVHYVSYFISVTLCWQCHVQDHRNNTRQMLLTAGVYQLS